LKTAERIKPELLFGIGIVSERTNPSSTSCACLKRGGWGVEGKSVRMLFDDENELFGICKRNVNFSTELQISFQAYLL
jgi:hypothetical protein